MKHIAIGIPFFASKHIEPLVLCLKSLKKYCELKYELFILLNCSDSVQYQEMCFPKILKEAQELHVKWYCGDDNAYKQTLVDWIANSNCNFDYMFILHSDVFLYKKKVLETMLEAIENTEHLISCWNVPVQLFRSTYHTSIENQIEFLVAPRVSSWLMCISVDKYRAFREKCDLGKYLFLGFCKNADNYPSNAIWHWFLEQTPRELQHYISDGKAIIDHGGILQYYLSMGEISGVYLGEDVNPSFSSMDLYYNPYGYVHIGQMDPNRYNDIFYRKSLLETRLKEVKRLIREDYCDDL